MDASIAMFAFGGFFVGMLVVSRVGAWIAGLLLVFEAPTTAEHRGFEVAGQLFLHSGPWFLAFAIGAIYYVASLSHPAWLWAVLSGFGLAVAVLVAAVTMARLRQRRGHTAPEPLTPKRLLKMRRRFFWGTSLYFGGTLAAFLLYQLWPHIGSNFIFVAFVLGACFGVGYLFSWFMWQFHSASLMAREETRRRAKRNDAA